jgi:two-component system, NarL family, nitrate/nitrite response regulator NarL
MGTAHARTPGRWLVRLVLADTHRLVIESLAAALTRRGCVVAALTTSAWGTFTGLGEHQPDICLLGASFPTCSGLGVLRVIRRRHPDLKVVMLADRHDRGLMAAAAERGAAGLITPDCHISDIMRILIRVRQGERVFGGGLPGGLAGELRLPAGGDWVPCLLTSREREVLARMVDGGSTQQIAHSLDITQATVRTHVQNVLVKMGVHSRLEAAAVIAESGVLSHLPDGPGRRAAGGG